MHLSAVVAYCARCQTSHDSGRRGRVSVATGAGNEGGSGGLGGGREGLTALGSVIGPHHHVCLFLLSVQTSDDPLIPIGLSHSLPPPRSAPCHISPLQQNEATPPPPAAARDVRSVATFGTRPRMPRCFEVRRRGRQRPLYAPGKPLLLCLRPRYE